MSKPQSMLFHQNSQYSRVMNLKYKSKYKKLKRQIKNFVFENAALCDEVAQVQGDLARAREERRYLIKRLIRHEGLDALQEQQTPNEEEQVLTEATPAINKTPNVPKKRGPKKRLPNATTPTGKSPNKPDRPTKTRAPRTRMLRDADGKLNFPINLSGTLMLHMPGEIISENYNFHTQHWIYPVGYVATRIYAHPKDPTRKCVFTCKILNNIGMPQFQIIPDNDFDSVFFGETANSCHQGLLEALQRAWPDVGSPSLPLQTQGERFFGLGNTTVMNLIQADPNFESCTRFKGFIIDGGYANDEKDPTLNFDALQSLFKISDYHTVPKVKDEPPDELFEQRTE